MLLLLLLWMRQRSVVIVQSVAQAFSGVSLEYQISFRERDWQCIHQAVADRFRQFCQLVIGSQQVLEPFAPLCTETSSRMPESIANAISEIERSRAIQQA